MPLLSNFPLRVLVLAMAAAIALAAPASAQTTITSQQADEILKELRAIRLAVEKLQVPAQPARPQAPPAPPEKVHIANVSGYMLGRPDAPITIVEFTDLQCPFCNRFAIQTFDRLKKDYIDTGKARFISRDYPLDFHPQARPAAIASRCAGEQGKFWDMRTALVRNAGRLSPAFIAETASSLKLNLPAFAACSTQPQHAAAIQKDIAEASSVDVSGTPTFFIGHTTAQGFDGYRVVGAQDYAVFQARLDSLLK